MYIAANAAKTPYRHRFSEFLLYGSFILGFLAGDVIVRSGSPHYISAIRIAASSQISITSLLATVILTFSLTAFISAAKKTSLFLIPCFVQALVYGVVSSSVYRAFGYAQWLIRILLLFTGTINIISLLWFWSRNISSKTQTAHRDFLLSFCVSIIATVLDHHWISPLLASLLSS